MKAADLPLARQLGIRVAPAGAAHLLELPFTPLLHNHLGTMHAAAQFALAEGASAECLQRNFAELSGRVFAVVRGVEVKYRKPATGDLLAFGAPDAATAAGLRSELAARGRAGAVILIDLKDRAGTLTFHGKFDWFISSVPPPVA
ncbi:MAG: YiiD C-terminal domain-containing protein [Lacunisphaera sp.]|nr:YiiD C-terminal domain-containing protein [Lacunisphaera sp.]